MNVPERIGRLFRREASLTSVRNVREQEARRAARLGAAHAALNAQLQWLEARVSTLETEVLDTGAKASSKV